MQKAPVDGCIEEADQLYGPFMAARDQACEESDTSKLTSPQVHGLCKRLSRNQRYKSCHPLHLHVGH